MYLSTVTSPVIWPCPCPEIIAVFSAVELNVKASAVNSVPDCKVSISLMRMSEPGKIWVDDPDWLLVT